MTWKTLALAGTATFALMTANAAFAQNGTTDTTPAATDTTTTDTDMKAPDAKADMKASDTAAMPAKKHHKKKMKAAMSESQEEMTTEKLNQQQLEKATAAATSGTGGMNNNTSMDSNMKSGTDSDTSGQKPLMGGQQSGTTSGPADNGNNSNPAAQSDKMGNGDMNNSEMKSDDMKKDMEKKKDDATPTPPDSTTPMP